MKLALSKLGRTNRKRDIRIVCVETGEVATAQEWGEEISKKTGGKAGNVAYELRIKAKNGGSYRGLTWKLSIRPCPGYNGVDCVLTEGHDGGCYADR